MCVVRCKSIVGSCVLVSPACVEVFSKVFLLFSLVTTEADFEDDLGPQRLMYDMGRGREGGTHECTIFVCF